MSRKGTAGTPPALRVARLIGQLTQLRPGSKNAERVRALLEHELMRIIRPGGLRAAQRAIAALNARGHSFAVTDRRGARRAWRQSLANGRRTLELALLAWRDVRTTSVSYHAVRPLRLTPRQRAAHELQQAFYRRYMEAGNRAYAAAAPKRLAPDDRLVLLVGELEADVNNGGFAQYLGNKGRRRAQAALAALEAIGAVKTAAMLAQALAPGATPALFGVLDRRFSRAPEDLAVCTMRHLARRKG